MRIAVASRDGSIIDEHFGHATQFLIWELSGSGLHQVETRQVRKDCGTGCDCGGSRPMQASIELVADCQAVLVAQIGEHAVSHLGKLGILVFESRDPVAVALQELALHEAVAPRRAEFGQAVA